MLSEVIYLRRLWINKCDCRTRSRRPNDGIFSGILQTRGLILMGTGSRSWLCSAIYWFDVCCWSQGNRSLHRILFLRSRRLGFWLWRSRIAEDVCCWSQGNRSLHRILFLRSRRLGFWLRRSRNVGDAWLTNFFELGKGIFWRIFSFWIIQRINLLWVFFLAHKESLLNLRLWWNGCVSSGSCNILLESSYAFRN